MKTNIFLQYLNELQSSMCQQLGQLEPAKDFTIDSWDRPQGGGGITCVLQNGETFDSAGVNISHVYGDNMPKSATAHRPELAGRSFEALGVSSVIHPKNPMAPTAHMNVRCFVASKEGSDPIWWFGGGFDLTPYYPFKEDCEFWHQTIVDACTPFGKDIYPTYKKWADDYFYLPHRQEHRGIGGLFFDDLNEQTWGWDFDRCQAFTTSIGEHFMKAYMPLLEKRIVMPYSDLQRDFQSYRRGRYVEFNLVYDRGTLFGLQSGGRTESILMSLPPRVKWEYCYTPEEDSKEAELYEYLVPRDWVTTAQ